MARARCGVGSKPATRSNWPACRPATAVPQVVSTHSSLTLSSSAMSLLKPGPMPCQLPSLGSAEHTKVSMADGGDGEVAVVGSGLVGVCSALHLARTGNRVVLIDPGPPERAASFGNA